MLEHVNFTVKDAQKAAKTLVDIFGWHIRWEGPSIHGGYTIHVGDDQQYIALYQYPERSGAERGGYEIVGRLNHIGIVVDDLEAVENKVKAAGFAPHNHADYEPGRRFYFDDADNIEFEVVSYH